MRSNSGRHYLALPGTPHGEYLAHGYPTADLITAALASKARHLLVIANSCFSGQLETELSALRKDLPPGRGLGRIEVFATADFDQMPRVREFADLLAEVHRYLRSGQAGYTEPWLSMDEFALELHQAHRRLGLFEPQRLLKPLASPERSPCLPNPDYQPVRHIVDPSLEQVATDADELDYWLDRATGRTSPTDPGWYFAGRTTLTTRIADFLHTGRGLLLVTGAAGTGKSAIVARTVTLSDPGFRTDPRYHAALAAAAADTLPPSGSITAAVLARNKSSDEIAEHLIRALGATPTAASGSTTRITDLRAQLIPLVERGNRVTTFVIDGVDEATHPTRLINDLVGPLLSRTGPNPLRLIVGVRIATPHSDDRDTGDGRHELLDLLHRFPAPITELRTDQDSVGDITTYLTNLLADRYPTPDRDILAARIAAVVAPSFLDARFAGQRLRTLPTPPGPHDPVTTLDLHDGTTGLLRQDLHDTATPDHPVPALLAALRATAFALGAGVPWADIWTAIATAVHDAPVSDATITQLLHSRLGGYLTRDTADERTVYRPVHETLSETLRDHPESLVEDPIPSDHTNIHHRITQHLAIRIPDDPDLPPHPYLRRHLIDHATRGHVLDDTHIPTRFLPWDTGNTVRIGLGLPITDNPEHAELAAWARIEPFLNDTPPHTRALAHDFARTTTGLPPKPTVHPPGLRPRWAHWTLTNNVLTHHDSTITAVISFTAHDRATHLATGSVDRTVQLWDPATGHQVGAPLTGHTGSVNAAAVVPMPDSRTLLATGSGDEKVRLWDPVAGRQVGVSFIGHTGPVLAVVAVPMPDGRTLLATGSVDKTVLLWDLEGDEVGRVVVGAIVRHIAVGCAPINGEAGLLAVAGEAGVAILDIVPLT